MNVETTMSERSVANPSLPVRPVFAYLGALLSLLMGGTSLLMLLDATLNRTWARLPVIAGSLTVTVVIAKGVIVSIRPKVHLNTAVILMCTAGLFVGINFSSASGYGFPFRFFPSTDPAVGEDKFVRQLLSVWLDFCIMAAILTIVGFASERWVGFKSNANSNN